MCGCVGVFVCGCVGVCVCGWVCGCVGVCACECVVTVGHIHPSLTFSVLSWSLKSGAPERMSLNLIVNDDFIQFHSMS
jgi:hypothetical protein